MAEMIHLAGSQELHVSTENDSLKFTRFIVFETRTALLLKDIKGTFHI